MNRIYRRQRNFAGGRGGYALAVVLVLLLVFVLLSSALLFAVSNYARSGRTKEDALQAELFAESLDGYIREELSGGGSLSDYMEGMLGDEAWEEGEAHARKLDISVPGMEETGELSAYVHYSQEKSGKTVVTVASVCVTNGSEFRLSCSYRRQAGKAGFDPVGRPS